MFGFFSKKNEKKTQENDGKSYKIAPLLYLVDWSNYRQLLGSNYTALMEVYLYRIWLYNFTFRRAVSEIDELVNPMLHQLINEIKTIGNSIFVLRYINDSNQDIQNALTNQLQATVSEEMFYRFEFYDDLVQKYIKEKQDIEATAIAFLELLRDVYKRNNIPVPSEENLNKVLDLCFTEVISPAGEVAKQKVNLYIEQLGKNQ